MIGSLLSRLLPHRQLVVFINLLSAVLLGGAALAEEVSVVAFGDSLTQGYGLVPDQGFVPQLQAYLEDHDADVLVINAGVSGDTSAGGASRIDWTLSDEPDGLILALGGNDALRGLPVEALRANLDAILGKLAAREIPVLLVGIDVPSNYGPEYRAEFEMVYTDLAEKYDAILMPNFLEGLAKQGDLALVLRDYMQSDGIHPNAAGVGLVVEAMGPKVLELIARVSP